MMTLDDNERKICRMAIRLTELDEKILSNEGGDAEIIAAENEQSDLRQEYGELVAAQPAAFELLKRRLAREA